MRSNCRYFNINNLNNLYSNLDNELINKVIEDYKIKIIFNIKTAKNKINKILNIEKIQHNTINKKLKQYIRKIIIKSNLLKNALYGFRRMEEDKNIIKQIDNILEQKKSDPIFKLKSLKEEPCFLDGLKCTEHPDELLLDKLLDSDLLQTSQYNKKFMGKTYIFDYDTEKEHLEVYKSKINEKVVEVVYNKRKGLKFGRVYPKKSIGAISIRKEIRGLLFYKKYSDLDISNAHPAWYYQIGRKIYNVNCPHLEKYIKNREIVLGVIMEYYKVDRDAAKSLFIAILYFGGFKRWANEYCKTKNPVELPFLSKLRAELSEIADHILEHNKLLIEQLIKVKGPMEPHQLKRTVISYYNQEIECRILEHIFKYCLSKGLVEDTAIACLCYDGIMILSKYYTPELLKEFSNEIKTHFGLDLSFESKKFDTSYLSILDEHIKPKVQRSNEIIINERYLLDENKLLNDTSDFVTNVKRFIDDDEMKVLNIKSPYGTGKTVFLKELFKEYPEMTKKTLMISYRVTLAHAFEATFTEFSNYKNGNDYTSDKLIISTESLLKMTNSGKLKRYQYIIIDEAESVLNQFNSFNTFKGKSAQSFELLVHLCKVGKTIMMDGDSSDRVMAFCDFIGPTIHINNIVNFNTKTLNIYHGKQSLNEFESLIFKDLDENKKICIPSMSATYIIELQQKILNKYPKMNVLLYTSTTSDDEKRDVMEIETKWAQAQVVLYSPTIEAGISCNVPGYFDRIFGYLCSNSCSQRSYMQMLSRIRQFNENNYYLYSEISCDTFHSKRWTFEELEANSIFDKNLILNDVYEYDEKTDEYKVTRKNSLYRTMYHHNMIEEKNKNIKIFMPIFIELAKSKGYKIKIKEVAKKMGKADKDLNKKYLDILESDNINSRQYEEYLNYQNQGKATTAHKLSIAKYICMAKLGIDHLNFTDDSSKKNAYDIIKTYYNNNTLQYYMGLIDTENISDTDTLQQRHKLTIIEIVSTLIKKLGFENCCDKKEIAKEEFTKKCTKVCRYMASLSEESNSIFNQHFNITKDNLNYLVDKDLNAQMRRINTCLNRCGVKISDTRKSKLKDTQTYCLKDIDFLSEILSNRISRDTFEQTDEKTKQKTLVKLNRFKFRDTNKIFKSVELNYFKEYINKKTKTDEKNIVYTGNEFD
jgi:hypothetical protein